MKNLLLESLSNKISGNLSVRRYNLSDMISESYKTLYACKSGSNMKKLVEAHIADIRENPTEIDRLSRNLSTLKELNRLVESGEIKDKDLNEKKKSRTDENCSKLAKECDSPLKKRMKDSNNYSLSKSKRAKKDLDEDASAPAKTSVDDEDLTDEEVEELAKYLEKIRKEKKTNNASNKDSSDPAYKAPVKEASHRGIKCKTRESKKEGMEESRDFDWNHSLYAVVKDDGTFAGVPCLSDEEAYQLAANHDGSHVYRLVELSNTNESKSPYSSMKEGLKAFSESSSSKAFYKTLKKMYNSLKEGVALTRKESIDLYKAANSAMTQMSIELEHNPEFLNTFNECTSILSSDVDSILGALKEGKAPSKKTMKSLAKFYESLLSDEKLDQLVESKENESKVVEKKPMKEAEDEVDTDDDFVGDDEGDIESEEAEEFNQEYADARVELHKDIAANHADSEDPEVQEKIEQDAAEVVGLPGITDEQVAEITGADAEDSDDSESEEDDDDISDDELEELKKHLKEMRENKKKR